MKKSEIFLLFFTLTLFIIIIIAFVGYLVKPSKTHIVINQENTLDIKIEDKIIKNSNNSNDWLSKISKQNQDFSYPTVIYHLKF